MGSDPPAFAGAGSRGQHDALDALAVGIESRAVSWILDADIKGFFDNISHEWMMRVVEYRIGDPRVLRLLRKWLTAGVVEDGVRQPATKGTPPASAGAGSRGGHLAPSLRLGQATAGEHLSPLRLRSVGRAMAATPCARRHDRGAIR